ncbi:MAG TPA: hypothetical protein VNK24_04115 [Elusimicrobiota bacterium]|nr:hypothetical protein [Elusimicrobiota bacterium]
MAKNHVPRVPPKKILAPLDVADASTRLAFGRAADEIAAAARKRTWSSCPRAARVS